MSLSGGTREASKAQDPQQIDPWELGALAGAGYCCRGVFWDARLVSGRCFSQLLEQLQDLPVGGDLERPDGLFGQSALGVSDVRPGAALSQVQNQPGKRGCPNGFVNG